MGGCGFWGIIPWGMKNGSHILPLSRESEQKVPRYVPNIDIDTQHLCALTDRAGRFVQAIQPSYKFIVMVGTVAPPK